ncbi:phosphatase 2C [Coemansia erecta]|nr:phosphatase 2C [Coemansia erecta]
MTNSTDKMREQSADTARCNEKTDPVPNFPDDDPRIPLPSANSQDAEALMSDNTTTVNDAESPIGECPTSPMSSTATFTGASSIQPRPRLQRSSIPPPINTENASKDADTNLRSKLLSNISPAVLDAAGQQVEGQTSVPDIPEDLVAPLAFSDIGESGEKVETDNTHCAHIGVSSSKNRRYRRTMEDAHFYSYDFDGVKGQCFMAIFDGHAGKQAAQWCSQNFADIFLELKKDFPDQSIPTLFNKAFIEADRRLAADVKTNSGCTAVVAFLQVTEVATDKGVERQRTLFCANVGDARAVLSQGGAAARLTYDHKGDDTREIERIFESGGYVFNGRVNGVLAVTRALGDSSLKQFVIGNPFTTETKLDNDDDLLILACDGLWDVCSDQEAVDLVRENMDPSRASQALLDYALSNESTDNITTMVFRLPLLS